MASIYVLKAVGRDMGNSEKKMMIMGCSFVAFNMALLFVCLAEGVLSAGLNHYAITQGYSEAGRRFVRFGRAFPYITFSYHGKTGSI